MCYRHFSVLFYYFRNSISNKFIINHNNQNFLNCAAVSIRSTLPKNIVLQQYLSILSSSKTFFLSSPFDVLSLNSSQRWAIGFPQLKHLIGIIIFNHLYDFCLFALAFPCLLGLCVSFLLTSATNSCLS